MNKTVAKKVPSEHEEAKAFFARVRLHEQNMPELRLLYAVPNGGDRHRAVAAKMKAEGVRPGVPDYALPVPRGGLHGLYIELKRLDGRASREQNEWIQGLRDRGYRAEVARGADEAWRILREYLGESQ